MEETQKKKPILKLFFLDSFLSFFIQLFGLTMALKSLEFLNNQGVNIPILSDTLAWWHFMIFFGGVTGLIIFLLKFPKALDIVLKTCYITTIGYGAVIALNVFLPQSFTMSHPLPYILAAFLVLLWFLIRRVWMNNLVLIMALAAFAVVFGFCLSVRDVIIILVLIAIWDVVAVFKLKVMIKILVECLKSLNILGLVVPLKNFSDFNAKLEEVRDDFEGFDRGKKPERFSLLGGGDACFPLLLTIAVLREFGLPAALIMVGFSFFSIFALWQMFGFILKKWPKVMGIPAMPPIVFIVLVGMAVVYFILPDYGIFITSVIAGFSLISLIVAWQIFLFIVEKKWRKVIDTPTV